MCSGRIVGNPYLTGLGKTGPSIDKNAARTVLVSAIATLVTTKPLSASLQRVMAGMKYQI